MAVIAKPAKHSSVSLGALLIFTGIGFLLSSVFRINQCSSPVKTIETKTGEQRKKGQNLPRLFGAVLGEDTSHSLFTSLDKLKAARPQLSSDILRLEQELYSFSVSALDSIQTHIHVPTALDLLEPQLPRINLHKATYGAPDKQFDVTWILKKLIFNSVLRIPKEFPLSTIFGTHPKNTPGRRLSSTLDVEATTTSGLQKISIPVTEDLHLERELVLSSAAGSASVSVSVAEYDTAITNAVKGKKGVEIGGPSKMFEDQGIYQQASSTDLVNFSEKTLWGTFEQGSTMNYKTGGSGSVHITDGSTLKGIDDEVYDFVLGSHYLEHLNNPLKALTTMRRVLKRGGQAILILPRKESCFDHIRGISRIEELTSRYLMQVSEEDLEYANVAKWTMGNDLSKDAPAGDFGQFLARSLRFVSNRAIHTMVYDLDLLRDIALLMRFEVVLRTVPATRPLHQIIILRKV